MIDNHCLPRPALHWVDGHILGNGDLGAVAWGSAQQFCFGLSKHDVNDLTHECPHGSRDAEPYTVRRDRVMAGERPRQFGMASSSQRARQQQVPCGRLMLDLMSYVQPERFEQRLSLRDGTLHLRLEPTSLSRNWGASYAAIELTARVLRGANALLVDLASDSEQAVCWEYRRAGGPYLDDPECRVDGDLGILRHDLPAGEGYGVALGSATGAMDVVVGPRGLSGCLRFGGDLGPARLLITVASVHDADGPADSAAIQLWGNLTADRLATLADEHTAWWQDFWTQARVELGEANWDALWTMGLYAMACSTRPDTSPPNLQGIWVQDDLSPWHVDFHFNTNVQECHWLAGSSNHPELQAALVRCLTRDWRPELERLCRDHYQCGGVAVTLNHDWLGRPIGGGLLGTCLGLTAWTAQHLWEQYRYTGDHDLLREAIYPWLRDAATLYRHALVRDENGQWNIELSESPEQVWCDRHGERMLVLGRNPAIDIAAIRELLDALLSAAAILGEDADDLLATAREIRDHLPPLPVSNGTLVDYETAFFDGEDRLGRFQHSHRHPSRLMAIFPAHLIGLHSSADDLELGRRSFREFHQAYGKGGFSGWSLPYQACIAARLGLGDQVADCLGDFADGHKLGGLLSSHNTLEPAVPGDPYPRGALFQIEALLGFTAAVNEMLVQRPPDGVIRVFPALPPGQDARFERLRVPGPALVSAEHDGERVVSIRVESLGATDLAIANPWPAAIVGTGTTTDRIIPLPDTPVTLRARE